MPLRALLPHLLDGIADPAAKPDEKRAECPGSDELAADYAHGGD